MKKEISRNRVLEILKGFPELENLSGLELVSKLVENVTLLEGEKAKIDRVVKKLEFSKEYNEEYNNILREEAEFDEQGNPKLVGNNQVVLKNNNKFAEKLKNFEDKFKDEIKRVEKERNSFNDYMEAKVTFEFVQIDKTILPPDISLKNYKLLSDML